MQEMFLLKRSVKSVDSINSQQVVRWSLRIFLHIKKMSSAEAAKRPKEKDDFMSRRTKRRRKEMMARDEFVDFDYELHRFKLLNVTHIKMSENLSQTSTFRNNSIKENTFLFYFLSFSSSSSHAAQMINFNTDQAGALQMVIIIGIMYYT